MKRLATSEAARKAARVLYALHLNPRGLVKSLSKAQKSDREQTLHWGWKSHIRGIGLGYKRVHGKLDLSQPCLTFYVRKKLLEHRLPKNERVNIPLTKYALGANNDPQEPA